MDSSADLIYQLIHKDAPEVVIFSSGLGLNIREQKEIFVRRFALKNNVSYLALDYTSRANKKDFHLVEQEAVQAIQENFSDKKLFFVGSCFGAMMSMRYANFFPEQTQNMIITSPAVQYSQVPLVDNILRMIKMNYRISSKMHVSDDTLNMLLLLYGIIETSRHLFAPQKVIYTGPISVLHPEKDHIIPLKNSVAMVNTLNRANVSLNVLTNETHTLSKDSQLKRTLSYLQAALQKERAF